MSVRATDARGSIGHRAALPWAGELVDDAALSARLGRSVRATYVRVKERRSLVVAWRAEDGSGERGWAGTFRDAAKRDNAVRRAARAGAALQEHEAGEAFLLSGPVASDPELAGELAGAWAALGEAPRAVLRYNPRRRVVARVGGDVVRVATTPAAALVQATRGWARLGAPVLPVSAVPGLAGTTRAPLWGHSDLLRSPDTRAAERIGRDVARVHASGAREGAQLAPDAGPQAAAVTAVAPWLGERVEALAVALGARVSAAPLVPLHGDLSPDQVLVGERGEARIIDLDRAARGPAARDLGSWAATCRLHGLAALGDAFLDGYGAAPGDVSAWEAHALLARALEPHRTLDPDWPAALEERVRLAEEALNR